MPEFGDDFYQQLLTYFSIHLSDFYCGFHTKDTSDNYIVYYWGQEGYLHFDNFQSKKEVVESIFKYLRIE